MKKNQKLTKFESLVENTPSNFLEKFKEIKKNKDWLEKSTNIAIRVLEVLREKNWSQKILAEKMGVSAQQVNKIVKGKENLTLETICKLENALGTLLIETIDFNSEILKEIATKATVLSNTSNRYISEIITAKREYTSYKKIQESGRMEVIFSRPNFKQECFSPELKKAV